MAGDMVYEDVPLLLKREGDVVVSGRNNTAVILGRDRLTSPESGHGSEKGAGALTLVVGRSSEDLSLGDDSATMMLSMRSSPDHELGTEEAGEASSVAVVRADRILLVPRNELVIKVGQAMIVVSSDGSVVIDGDISFGSGAAERLIKESFAKVVFPTHTHSVAAAPGVTGPPVVQVPDSVLTPRVRST